MTCQCSISKIVRGHMDLAAAKNAGIKNVFADDAWNNPSRPTISSNHLHLTFS